MSKTEVKLSIIVATYNAASCIADALASVCALDYDAWECVVVDGLSNDGTMDIVKRYAAQDTRIRFVSERDNGIYDAFNKGWQMANGEYVYYLGADDTLYPDAMCWLRDGVHTADIVYGTVDFKWGALVRKGTEHFQPERLRKANLCSHQAMVMRRRAIEKLGGFDLRYRITADFDLLQRAFLAGCSFLHIDVCFGLHDTYGVSGGGRADFDCYHIRQNNHSVSTCVNWILTVHALYMRCRTKIIKKIKNLYHAKHTNIQ